jgi:hypothetical protein
MRIQVSEARLLRDLLAYLRACGCVAEQASATEADVFMPELHNDRTARMELGVYLKAWSIRQDGVQAEIVQVDAPRQKR